MVRRICLISVRVRNVGDEQRTFEQSSQYLFDTAGRRFETGDAGLYLEDSKSFLEEINPGNGVNGTLVYDVPKSFKAAKADGSIKLSTDTVIEGKSIVTGVRTRGTPWSPSGLSVLNVQVRDARIEPIQAGSVPPALKGLTGQHLLYLGQSDGTLVLYDPTGAEVVYVPRGFVLLNVQVI